MKSKVQPASKRGSVVRAKCICICNTIRDYFFFHDWNFEFNIITAYTLPAHLIGQTQLLRLGMKTVTYVPGPYL